MLLSEEVSKRAVLKALSDDHSRLILLSTIQSAKSVPEIMREQGIPMSSAYRRVKQLKHDGLLKVEKVVVTEEGKKYDLLRSAIRAAVIRFESGVLEVDVSTNVLAEEKMLRRFFALKEAK